MNADNCNPKPGDRDSSKSPNEFVTVTREHAYSLVELVKWFKAMIETGNVPESQKRSDELTAAYCDELLEDLGQ